jgi:hypothetical protein
LLLGITISIILFNNYSCAYNIYWILGFYYIYYIKSSIGNKGGIFSQMPIPKSLYLKIKVFKYILVFKYL